MTGNRDIRGAGRFSLGHKILTEDKPKPILYLLKPGFLDADLGPDNYYCPYCVRIEGMLSVFPVLRQELDIRYVDFAKPRGQLAQFAGADSQSCPQLIFQSGDDDLSSNWSVAGENKVRRIHETAKIAEYFSARFNLPVAH